MRKNFSYYIKQELSGWNIAEILWLVSSCLLIVVLSIYWKDSILGIISAVSGVAYVIFTGKGKLTSFLFGMVNALLYALISYNARFYGEVMLNILYYFPMQFYGLYVWVRYMNPETGEVVKRRMSTKNRLYLWLTVFVSSLLYGCILKKMGGNMPFVDALSTVISVVALVVAIKRYAEQWMLWTVVNSVTVVMWVLSFINGGENIATLIMWLLYLVNGIILHIKWTKETK